MELLPSVTSLRGASAGMRLPRVAAVQQEAKLSVYRVGAGVVSERAAGLLLFRTHTL